MLLLRKKSCPSIFSTQFEKLAAIRGKHRSEVLSSVSSNGDIFPEEGMSPHYKKDTEALEHVQKRAVKL